MIVLVTGSFLFNFTHLVSDVYIFFSNFKVANLFSHDHAGRGGFDLTAKIITRLVLASVLEPFEVHLLKFTLLTPVH